MAAPNREGLVLGIDVGGTGSKGAVIDYQGQVVAMSRRPTQRERGAAAVVESILDFAGDLVRNVSVMPAARGIEAAAVVVPGFVDDVAGVARVSIYLKWHDVPLRRLLEERLGVPVVVGHDVHAANLAERLLGAARNCDNYLFLTLGTGVGAALVVNGAVYEGAHGVGGEFGHMIVEPGGPRCACGHEGCIEALASATAVAGRYQAMARCTASITARDVAERATAGDVIAARVWGEAIMALSRGVANYITLLDPERVVIGGGMAAAGSALFGPLIEQLVSEVRFQSLPPVLRAELGEDAGYLGAALKAWLALGAPKAELAWRGTMAGEAPRGT